MLGQALADLRRIAEGMENLPRLLEVLTSIDAKVDALNDDVGRMRGGVDSINDKIDELDDSLAPAEAARPALAPPRRRRGRGVIVPPF